MRPRALGVSRVGQPRVPRLLAPRVKAVVSALFVVLGGCEEAGAGQRARCRFGAEYVVTRARAQAFDGLAAVRYDGGVVALWSEPAGLFARKLDPRGKPTAEPVRVGERCGAGLAAQGGAALWVACARRPGGSDKQAVPGQVIRMRLNAQLRAEQVAVLGATGSLSQGVAIAGPATGVPSVAWIEGSPDVQRLWLATSDSPPAVMSTPRRVPGPPSLHFRSQLELVWAETWLQEGEPSAAVLAVRGAGGARTLTSVLHEAARPQLVTVGEDLWLAFRDRRPRGRRAGLYAAVLEAGALSGKATRVGRADGDARPGLASCLEGVVFATPRTYGGDYFVGVNFLDRRLRKSTGEQQFYEDTHEFGLAAVACIGEWALVLIAERGSLRHTHTRIRAVTYSCQ